MADTDTDDALTEAPGPAPRSALFALGFRPFFLLAGVFAVLLIALWLGSWSTGQPASSYYGVVGWHSHEMLFGYAVAVVTGFLFTAVRNWTGMDTPIGSQLAGLAALWLLGRLLPLFHDAVPGWLIALVDLAFIPAATLALYKPLVYGGNKVNRVFLLILGSMALANLLVHLKALGLVERTTLGTDLMINTLLILVTFIGGRVMPFFTERAIEGARPKEDPSLERLIYILLVAIALVDLFLPAPWLSGALAAGLGATLSMRLAGWYDRRIWGIPILWVLYTAFGWLIIGYFLRTAATAGWMAPTVALHGLTMGAVGVLTLGMMARVTLGHTGRDMRSNKLTNIAFVLLNLGVAVRVFLPLLAPDSYVRWIHISGGLWILAFLLFCLVHVPMLAQPRIDGRPG